VAHTNTRLSLIQLPTFRGFQTYFGEIGHSDHFNHKIKSGANALFSQPKEFCGAKCLKSVRSPGRYSSALYADKTVEKVNRHDPSKGPLFMYLAFTAVHSPLQAPANYIRQYSQRSWGYQKKVYGGMITATDDAIKRVVNAMKKKGIWGNTLVVVTTDNGAVTESCADNGRKTVCGPLVSTQPVMPCSAMGQEEAVRTAGALDCH